MLLDQLDAADFDDDVADDAVLPKLQEHSGLDVFAFHAVVSAMLPFRPTGPLH